ncbi:Methionine synthase [Austwickia sp. TVS 96-490-7B]|uniref:methionine synthase n=1 Tax=Austwickia sp. TVS 96-490-7B TaxID=2830843 RepID=UPI001C5807C3|nr:methionine synthase [Austwickia sp. TVS 96-490-7B]MBW3085380.1 Methionine synthase [Austwickia sp. TVS 96-490-7B]
MSSRSSSFRALLGHQVIVLDGGMGTMLQAQDPSLVDFQDYEGCNEILNVTRPDMVRSVHDAYFAVGCDAVETNTFGANLANLGEYGIPDRIFDLAHAGAIVAREAADAWSTESHPRFVVGSIGPGTKLPSLGHARYADLRDAYQRCADGLITGGADALLVETCQDLLQAKAAIVGARRAREHYGVDVPIMVQVTVETTGTMLMGSEIGAALTALVPLGIDAIGLNCATGPAEMSEHLRHLAANSPVPISVLPNAGLPELTKDGAYYPLTPAELASAHDRFVQEYGVAVVGGCCGTTPDHLRAVVDQVRGRPVPPRAAVDEPSVASLYTAVPLRQDTTYLSIGERTNANGSKAFREALLDGRLDDCLDIARDQTRDGAHLLDVCVDYVGRDGTADMSELAYRLATTSTLPLVLDSTEPAVIRAGLERLGGRAVINSVNFEDGDGPDSRFTRMMQLVEEHGAAVVALTIDETGQARTADHKVAVATRLVDTLTGKWGLSVGDIIVDCLTFPIATGQEETRRDAIETMDAIKQITSQYPGIGTTLGVSNVSFGLKPPARVVLNSVFLDECVQAGLTSAIVNSAKILPVARIPEEQRRVALDLIHDRREYDADGVLTYDPLARMLELFEGVDSTTIKQTRAAALAALPLDERLARRIVDGERQGLEADLDQALAEGQDPLDIINDHLLAGMKTVGELFGSGQMQLPFVLQSAETMKTAVAHLEPAIHAAIPDGQTRRAKAKILLATVKGDVHDIGKNLVEIILSNNGYDVVNLGIKQPINDIIAAAEHHDVDAIGMSGLLVKSTVIMKDNLEELNTRGLATRWPVLLGGAALTRAYVEGDLADIYAGEVRYARDAFEGLRLMDAIAAARTGQASSLADALPARRPRRTTATIAHTTNTDSTDTTRSAIARDIDVPTPPFWGTRVSKGIALADYATYLDERATFLGQWGLKPGRGGGDGHASASYDELVATEGQPRLRMWFDRIAAEKIMEPAVVHGYFPCYSDGNDLVVLDPTDTGQSATPIARFTFPRQRRDRRWCLADFFRDREQIDIHGPDVLALQLVTMGPRVSTVTTDLYSRNAYRDYLELHGLSVQLTEALAEMWHARIRTELRLETPGQVTPSDAIAVRFRGCRYSFGYPACPNLDDRATLVQLLDPTRIGVTLSEELQLHPEQSTDALIVHHPEATYFKV